MHGEASHAVYKPSVTHCKGCPLGKDYSKNPTDNGFLKYQLQDPVIGRLLVLPKKADLECYMRENTARNAYQSYKLKITNLWLKKSPTKPETTIIKQTNKQGKPASSGLTHFCFLT